MLREAGVEFESVDGTPDDLVARSSTDRWERATVLAALTTQGGLLPVVLTRGWDGFVSQEKIEEFVR